MTEKERISLGKKSKQRTIDLKRNQKCPMETVISPLKKINKETNSDKSGGDQCTQSHICNLETNSGIFSFLVLSWLLSVPKMGQLTVGENRQAEVDVSSCFNGAEVKILG